MSQAFYANMEKAPQRALLKALGLTDEEIEKPLIAVVSAISEASPEYSHLGSITDAVKAGVYTGGCTPVVMPLSGICTGLALDHAGARYALPSRELVADSAESLIEAYGFDGAVFVAGGAIDAAGMLMGAARVNIPSVFVCGGPMPSGLFNGAKVGFADVYDGIDSVKNGTMSLADLTALETVACPGCGSDSGMNAANALFCVLEALGMALPYNGTAPSSSGERIKLAKRTGEAVCKLVREAVTPRMIMTKHAFTNALTLDTALGASSSTVLHLLAVAAECNVALDLDTVKQVSDVTPTLCRLAPEGDADMEDLHKAGGVPAALHELAKNKLIDGSAYTAEACALADCYEHAHVKNAEVIHKIDSPISPVGNITVVKGNLAENGALATRAVGTFTGKAKCFNSEEDAVAAINSGRIKKGDVAVIRYEGPVGGPGMREMRAVISALKSKGLDKEVVVVTDGRFTGTADCAAVCHVSPEAAEDGKIALVADGDVIKLDVNNGKIALDVTAKILETRRKKLRPKDTDVSGYLLRYQNLVTSAAFGAVLKKKF